jgi:hypothetical protein
LNCGTSILGLKHDTHALFVMREGIDAGGQEKEPHDARKWPSEPRATHEMTLLGWTAGLEVLLTVFLIFAVSALFQAGR